MKRKIDLKRNIFDRVVEAVSPVSAARRYQARLQISQARGLYDGASSGRRIRPNIKTGTLARLEGGADVYALADRAQGLIRNDGYAKRGRNILQAYGTGTGVKGTIKNASGIRDENLQRIWDAWANSRECDARMRGNFYSLQRLAFNSMIVSGEAIIGRVTTALDPLRPEKVPLALHVMESRHLDKAKHNDKDIIFGVRYNGAAPAEYYILPDPSRNIGSWIPASEIIHLYDEERAGQTRGVSWFAPVILNIQDLGDYRDSERVRRKVAACFGAFVEEAPDGEFTDDEMDEFGKMEPGAIERLRPGQKITFSNPPESRDYDPYVRVETQMIASGLGVTYEHLSQSLKDVNFSSAKIGQIPFKKTVEVWQELIIQPQFLDRVWEWFREFAILSGMTQFENATIEWTFPKFEMLDEEKETDALASKVRNGFMTQSEAIRQQGYDPEVVLTEWAQDFERLRALGVRLDTVPEWFTKAGILQTDQNE